MQTKLAKYKPRLIKIDAVVFDITRIIEVWNTITMRFQGLQTRRHINIIIPFTCVDYQLNLAGKVIRYVHSPVCKFHIYNLNADKDDKIKMRVQLSYMSGTGQKSSICLIYLNI